MQQRAAAIPHLDAVFTLPNESDQFVSELNQLRNNMHLASVNSVPLSISTEIKYNHIDIKLEPVSYFSRLCRRGIVGLGGTFDHLHFGHKILLTTGALLATERLGIGLSGDELLAKKKFPTVLESYASREAALRYFVNLVNPSIILTVEPLHDMYGPSLRPEWELLLVSEETANGGELVNIKRQELGLNRVDVHVVELASGDGSGGASDKLSSTAIRALLVDIDAKRKLRLRARWANLCDELKVSAYNMENWWRSWLEFCSIRIIISLTNSLQPLLAMRRSLLSSDLTRKLWPFS